jgi:chromate transporter
VWLGPLVLLAAILGPDHLLVQIGALFASAAAVTFGGAYAVLAWVAQQAVEQHQWLTAREMLDGLGFAETTPGPLIQVVQFVAFLAAWRQPGELSPLAAAVAASVIATWVTFAPSFLWIFTGAPWIEWLRGSAWLGGALSAITAAVVGVVANLGLWLAVHVWFGQVDEVRGVLGVRWLVPVASTVHPAAIAIGLGATVAMLGFHTRMLPTLAVGAVLGWLLS